MPDPTTVYDSFDGWGRAPSESNRERIERTLALVPDDVRSVLDVGCGDGAVSNPLVERGLAVTGMDISRVALGHFRGAGCVASVDALPFAAGAFDLVLCCEVLEHLPQAVYGPALAELGRVTGRYILLTTPNEQYLPAQFARCADCGCIFHSEHHVRVFDAASHRALFPRFEAAASVPIGLRRSSPLAVALDHAVLGRYRKRAHPCPLCGGTRTRVDELGLARRLLKRCIRLLGKVLPSHPRPRWLATLYRTKE